jgi:hypothetical protein
MAVLYLLLGGNVSAIGGEPPGAVDADDNGMRRRRTDIVGEAS